MMGDTAVWTAAHYKIPMLIVVCNNRSFFNDELHQERVARIRNRPVENRWIGQRISEPDIDCSGVAKAQGAIGFDPVTKTRDLVPVFEKAIAAVEAGGMAVVDVRVEPGYSAVPLRRCCAGPRRPEEVTIWRGGATVAETSRWNAPSLSLLTLAAATRRRRRFHASARRRAAAELFKITVGQRGNWDTSVAHLGDKAGIFKKHGIELEIVYTSGSGETLQPVIAGAAEMGFAVGTQGAMAAYQGRAGAHHRRRSDRRRRLLVCEGDPRRSKLSRTPTATPSRSRPRARRRRASSAPSSTSSS